MDGGARQTWQTVMELIAYAISPSGERYKAPGNRFGYEQSFVAPSLQSLSRLEGSRVGPDREIVTSP